MNDTLKLSDPVSYISTAICGTIGTAVGFAIGIEIGNFNDNTDFFWAVVTGVIASSVDAFVIITLIHFWMRFAPSFSGRSFDNFIQFLVFSQAGIVVSFVLKNQLLIAVGFVISYWIISLASLVLIRIFPNAKAGALLVSAMLFIYLLTLTLGIAARLEAITKLGLVFGHLSVVSLWQGCFGGINTTILPVLGSAILTTLALGATMGVKLAWLGLTKLSPLLIVNSQLS